MSPPAKKNDAPKSKAQAPSAKASGQRSGGAKASGKESGKAAAKSPAKSGAKAGGAKTGGAKSSAVKETPKKAAPKKSAPKKKRAAKKKTSPLRALVYAFIAGALLTAAASWYLRDFAPRDVVAGFFEKNVPAAVQEQIAGTGPGKKEGRPSAAPGETRASAPTRPAENAAASPAPSGRPEGEADPDLERAASRAVAGALIDLQNLPYEESLAAGLDERIRQVDYAIMQAAWMRKFTAASLRLVSVEDRLEGIEPYQFQVIDILPGKEEAKFIASLKDCLAAWAEGASLIASGKNTWAVSLNGVQTHSLRLYPQKTAFPSLPGQKAPSAVPRKAAAPAGPSAREGAPHRLRADDEEARLAIVIDDLGASRSAVDRLLALDYPVSFAFWPHGRYTREGARAAYSRGREVLVHQPMEPLGYPKVQPGPNVLLRGMDEARIRRILGESIKAVPHASGLNNHMGSLFTQDRDGVGVVARVLKERDLFMLDSATHPRSVFAAEGRRQGLENYRNNVFIDTAHTREAVLDALRRAEKIARITGRAVAIGHPLPTTLDALRDWQRLRGKDVRIVRLRELHK